MVLWYHECMSNYSRVAEGKTKLQYVLPEDLDRRMRDYAAKSGKTLTAINIEAVEALLAVVAPPPTRKRRGR